MFFWTISIKFKEDIMVKIDNSKDDTKEIGMVNVYLKNKIIVKFHSRNFIKIFKVHIYFNLVSKRTGI